MTRRERLRRIAILCHNCARNVAYYRAGRHEGRTVFDEARNIFATINSNFLDIAVMEWCKLFDHGEEHGWGKVISDGDAFKTGLLTDLGIDEAEWNAYFKKMRTYRDKFLAHLDREKVMYPPQMDIARASVIYYYNYLLQYENDGATFEGAPSDLEAYYEICDDEGRAYYGSNIVS